MKMPLTLTLLLLLLLLQQTHCSASACEELTCFADYLQTLMCTWGWSLWPSRDTPYNLTAKWNCGAGGTCHLLPSTSNTTAAQFTCLAEQNLCFGDNTFDVTATAAAENKPPGVPKGCSKTFLFKENIKPQPPFNLTADASPSGYNVSWKTPYQHWQFHPLNGQLRYELRYRQRGHTWQVRRQPRGTEREGRGKGAFWAPEEPKRLWKKLDLFVPSPAPFFQPLYVGHKGDFKKWVGTPGVRATLEVSESGPGAGLEAFGMGSLQLLLPSPGDAQYREAEAAGQATPTAPLLAAERAAQEQTYGHLSIDTVTVAEGVVPCCLQCGRCASTCCAAEQPQHQEEEEEENQEEEEEASASDTYRRIHFEGSSQDGQVPGTVLKVEGVPQRNAIPPFSSWLNPPLPAASTTLPPFKQVGGSLGGGPGNGPLFLFGPPLPSPPSPERWSLSLGGLSAPEAETLFYSTLLSLYLEADDEGDPDNGLDLDTIDSGFVDCDSPLDSEFEPRLAGGREEGVAAADSLPSYVKQWLKA
ncbi:hypothetical protein JD844_019456 [Phrynosoma platyrhinos]|uniref:Uncharacterized protein n=1 Tax=Phrynosoma platyrhinos TaxID=52577 RepID=A0ABQ7TPH0_PHRPL|nr:hypothetical protein JD844_019456 [Phrynosoma platyrhinos]